jgi:hypothetical protein
MASQIANFASCLGNYDATLQGTGYTMDISGLVGSSDLSLNTGYLSNTTAFVMPTASNGRGISFTGWFNPIGLQSSSYTPIFDVSCGPTNSSIILTISGDTITNNPFLVGNYTVNGTTITITTPTAQVLSNAWNFFAYTLCCSGSTLVQNLYVNNNITSLTGGTYSALTFSQTVLGYGFGNFANYYNGKIDDFRYYARVITPMEIRVLNSFNYGNNNVTSLIPSLGTITFTAGLPTSVPFVFSNTGTYSYLQYKRIGNNGSATQGILSPTVMSASGQSYTWSDTTVTPAITYLYTWTPFILGTPGMPSGVQSIYTLAPASAFTGLSASAFTPTGGAGGWTGFKLNWIGGSGTSITYTAYMNGILTSVNSGNLNDGSTGVIFSGLTAPTSGTTPTPYAWYIDICANNLAGTTHGIYTVYAPPTTLVLTSSYNSTTNQVTLTWGGGIAGNTVNYYYYIRSGTGTQSSAPITSPAVISVTNGGGPWIFDVSATNTSGTVVTSTTVSATPFTITSITTSNGSYLTDQKSSLSGNLSTGNGIVGGTSTTSGITYNNYAFGQTSTWGTYTISYTCGSSSYMYVLAVGGGGGGGYYGCGGGGGGGVVMLPVIIPASSSQTITISVGNGGTWPGSGQIAFDGSNSTVVFNVNTSLNILANGGGGSGYNPAHTSAGGLGGGGNNYLGGSKNNSNYNYSTAGGNPYPSGNDSAGGGGGGAGTAGANGISNNGGVGGNGIKCILPGINSFSPSGVTYGTYFWSGGGGGSDAGVGGVGGSGGGGGGGGGGALGGGGGISSGGTSGTSSGAGGKNTGGGGGGAFVNNGNSGGSGIVVIAFPQTTIPVVTLTVTSVSSTGFTLNFASVINATSYILHINNVLYGSTITAGTNNTITQTSTTGWFTIDFYAKNIGGTIIAEGHNKT